MKNNIVLICIKAVTWWFGKLYKDEVEYRIIGLENDYDCIVYSIQYRSKRTLFIWKFIDTTECSSYLQTKGKLNRLLKSIEEEIRLNKMIMD